MNAKELTDKYFTLKYQNDDFEKRIDYLEQENIKLRRIIEDMKIDIKMMNNIKR